MDSDCFRLQTCTPFANEPKQLEGLRLFSSQARTRLDIGYFSSGLVCRSRLYCCNFGHERRFTVIEADEFGFGSNPTWRTRHEGLCRLDPLASFVCKGEMMEDGGPNGAIEANCQSDQAKRTQSSTSSLPGFIYPLTTTVGKSTNIGWQECMVKREEREKLLRQKGCVIWITGLSGSGKSTLACTLDHQLFKRGNLSYVLDGDNLRHGLNKNLGFTAEDRAENIRRIGEVARIFVDAGVICIASAISPYRKDRDACRQLLQPGEFIEVAVVRSVGHGKAGIKKGVIISDDQFEALQTWSCTQRTTWSSHTTTLFSLKLLHVCTGELASITSDSQKVVRISENLRRTRELEAVFHDRKVYMNFPLMLCEKRDPKGLYKLARAGKIKGFTGVDDPYEAPLNSEVVMEPIEGRCPTPAEMANQLLSYLEQKRFL